VLGATAVLIALALPLLLVSMALSPTSMTAVALSASNVLERPGNIVGLALRPQLAQPVLWLAAAGTLLAVVRRDRHAIFFVSLIACVFVGLLMAGQLDPARHSVYWVPALSVMAGSVAVGWSTRWVARVAMIGVLSVAALQVRAVRNVSLAGAQGYEEAARFVLRSNPGPTVLFSGDVDTGFFTFFVRKHDADRRLVVLRSDKLLTTSFLGRLAFEKRITGPSDIYPILQRFGTRYVVIEDRPSRSPVLEWLRQELRSSRFVERARIPIVSREPRIRGTSLAIYEFTDMTPPAEDAVLSMNLPIVRRSLAVKLSDLIERKYLR
jgi:hypothetical protein